MTSCHADYELSNHTQPNYIMKIIFGYSSPFEWASHELAKSLLKMTPIIHRVVQEVASKNACDPRTLFVLTACPCCEDTGLPENLNGVIVVTPYRGLDHGLYHKIKAIDVYPPFCGRSGEAQDEEQFALHWKKTIEEAIS